MNYAALWNEISFDPAGKGYATMTDAEIASAINAYTEELDRTSITSAELWENTALAEYKSLSVAEGQAYGVLISLATIDISPGSNSRVALLALFPTGSTTRDNLVALAQTPVITSRAAILGLGRVKPGYVAKARAWGGE